MTGFGGEVGGGGGGLVPTDRLVVSPTKGSKSARGGAGAAGAGRCLAFSGRTWREAPGVGMMGRYSAAQSFSR